MVKKKSKKQWLYFMIFFSLIVFMGLGQIGQLQASTVSSVELPGMTVNMKESATPADVSATLQMIFVITIIALAPSILILMTSFLRIIISLHFVRSALGTTTMPPNQALVGIALFLTFFVMSPVVAQIKTTAIEPFEQGEITQEVAIEKGIIPLKDFMLKQTRDEDISLFMDIAGEKPYKDTQEALEKMPLHVIVPAFIISELRAGFLIGFLVYIPFIVIDMVVASTLMSMGMMMLPPAMISLPFKVLLFVLVDGWNLFIGQLLQTFN